MSALPGLSDLLVKFDSNAEDEFCLPFEFGCVMLDRYFFLPQLIFVARWSALWPSAHLIKFRTLYSLVVSNLAREYIYN